MERVEEGWEKSRGGVRAEWRGLERGGEGWSGVVKGCEGWSGIERDGGMWRGT